MTGFNHPLLQKLTSGDRRSIGNVDEVIAIILEQPDLFAVLIAGMQVDDPLVRMRAADAAEKITIERPGWLQPYKRRIIAEIAAIRQQEVRWHVAQLLPRLALSETERSEAFTILTGYLSDPSAIVRTFSLQALADLALSDPALSPQVTALLEQRLESGSKAERSRARKLLGR
jgi:hypothetical protein